MTDPSDYLDAVRQRVEAATEGPWKHDGDIPARQWGVVYQRDALVDSIGQSDRPVFTLQLSSIPRASWMADADFIAHARTDVPRLLAAVEAAIAIFDEAPFVDVYDDADEAWNAALSASRNKVTKAINDALGGDS